MCDVPMCKRECTTPCIPSSGAVRLSETTEWCGASWGVNALSVQVWRCDVQGLDEIFCTNSQFVQLIHVRAHYLLQSFSDEQAEDPPSNQNEPQTDCDSDSDQNKGNDSKNPLELKELVQLLAKVGGYAVCIPPPRLSHLVS